MEKKYELTNENIVIDNHTLHRIRSLKDFNDVKKGDLGGFIESEKNLSQYGDCWIYDKARIFSNASVYDSVAVYNNAQVHGNAEVYEKSKIFDDAEIYGNAQIFGKAKVYGKVRIFDNVIINNAEVYGSSKVFGSVLICDNIKVSNIELSEHIVLQGDIVIESNFDLIIFRKFWTEKEEYIVYTRPNNMFSCGDFYGNEEEFIENELEKGKKNGVNCYLLLEFIKMIK